MVELTSVAGKPAMQPAIAMKWVRMGEATREPSHPADGILDERTRQRHAGASPAASDDARLVRALRAGDEAAFTSLVTGFYPAMVRVALLYVHNRAVAEEVVQQTWLGVLQGVGRFEGRSSLKTWIFHILMNVAKTYGRREGRSIPFSSLAATELDGDDPAVDPERFQSDESSNARGHWVSNPQNWDELPEERVLSLETRDRIAQTLEALPPAQREVIQLRDVEGFSADEVCDLLGISQARSKVRRALERYLSEV
jgi:RNA polymerase sigma-70 factor, ECF subfamily